MDQHNNIISSLVVIITLSCIILFYFSFYSGVKEEVSSYLNLSLRNLGDVKNNGSFSYSFPIDRDFLSKEAKKDGINYKLENESNLIVLKPNGNGNKSEIPSETPIGGIHWQLVSDNNDSSYIIENIATATSFTDTYQVQNVSSIPGVILSVSVNVRARTSIAFSNGRVMTILRTYDNEYIGSTNEPTDNWKNYSDIFFSNPITLSNWTWSEVNSMEVGVTLRALPQQNRECWCSEVWVEVNYTQIDDNIPPMVNDFGINDYGNGSGTFWADIKDPLSGVETVLISINGSEYSMINNGSHWIYPVLGEYNACYDYQITNSSDLSGNYLNSTSNIKGYTFNKDIVNPKVGLPVYDPEFGNNGTFRVNVTDSWGEIDIVLVSITESQGVPKNDLWTVMVHTDTEFITDNLLIDKGSFKYVIIANDTAGNLNSSVEMSSNSPNHIPEIFDLFLSRDQDNRNFSIDSNCTLYAHYSFFDIDNDSEIGSEIRWYRNGIIQPAHNNSFQISSTYLLKNDVWYVTVKPKDGQNFGFLQVSDLITVRNIHPFVNNYYYVFEMNQSQVLPDLRSNLATQIFFVEDENISISYKFEDYDEPIDFDQSKIQWFYQSNSGPWVEAIPYQNKTYIPSSVTSSGDYWKCILTPFDGMDIGRSVDFGVIYIESRPTILMYSVSSVIVNNIGLYYNEGNYEFQIVANNLRPISSVEFLINDTYNSPYYAIKSNENDSNWILDYRIPLEEFQEVFLNNVLTSEVRVCSLVEYEGKEFTIYAKCIFSITIEDETPPRVVGTPIFELNDEVNPSSITFYTNVVDYGSEITNVSLYYYYKRVTENEKSISGGGAGYQQENKPSWNIADMSFLSFDATNKIHTYSVTVPFNYNGSSRAIIFYIETTDSSGNKGITYDVTNNPEMIREIRFVHLPVEFDPSIMIIFFAVGILLSFFGSIVYTKFIRKPEIIGFDKELVITKISEIKEVEILEILDVHTLGVVTSFFDQLHGPVPIIVTPEILKDNITKLIELSDRSFATTGFKDDTEGEICSFFDFLISEDVRIISLSFGFALKRPKARGGVENLSLNILIYHDLFKVISHFLDEIQQKVHSLHELMNEHGSEKEIIVSKVIELRKFISYIILAYEKTYDNTDLIIQSMTNLEREIKSQN